MYKIYGDKRSGHCYKVQLVCALLNIQYEWIDIDLIKKQQFTDEFLAINPRHKTPALVLHDGNVLLESNAIVYYLATQHGQAHGFIPTDALQHTQMLQWQFYEQSQFHPPISAIRWIKHYLDMLKERLAEYQLKLEAAQQNFVFLDQYLAKQPFLVNEQITLADICLFAYAHVADMGGIDFKNYAHVSNWIQRIKDQENFLAISR